MVYRNGHAGARRLGRGESEPGFTLGLGTSSLVRRSSGVSQSNLSVFFKKGESFLFAYSVTVAYCVSTELTSGYSLGGNTG